MAGDIRGYYDALYDDPTRVVVLVTPDWSGVLDASVTCRFKLRLTREDILEGSTSVFDPTDERLAPAREEQRRTGSFEGDLRLLSKGGAPFEATVSVVSGVQAGIKDSGLAGLAIVEFTAYRQVPVGLEEEWSRTPLHHSPDVVALYEADGTLRYISPSVKDVLGYAPEEVVGRVTIGLVHPEDVEPMIDAMLGAKGISGAPRAFVFRVRHKDGGWRHLEVLLKDLSEDPSIGGTTVHFRDITERVEELEERYLDSLNGSSVGVANVTVDGRILHFNERFSEISGRQREELLGLPSLHAAVHPDDREAHRMEMEGVAGGENGASSSEWRYVRGNGSVAWVSSRVRRTTGADPLDKLVVMVEDVSERKEAEVVWGLLSPREREVLGMVGLGMSNRDIAGALHLSTHTVKYHVQSVLRKLGVADRNQAAARVAELDLSPPARG